MKIKPTFFPIILVLVLAASPPVFALGFRCGTRIITVGDTKSKVIAQCGAPNHIEEWEEERIMRDFHYSAYPEREHEWDRRPFLVKIFVKVEEWSYNFGPSRLIYCLRFRNGRLVKITTGERGYKTFE